jgi:transcriptional regulator GlxA family with amidase domain
MKRQVALLIFPDVEVLDFAGPFEVFAAADELHGGQAFHPFTVAESPGSVRAHHGLKVVPDHTLESCPRPDILVVPGGIGTRPLLQKPSVLEWLRQRARTAEHVVSVCTGALLLARAGLLHNLRATTHHENFAELARLAPNTDLDEAGRFTDNGQVLTSGGVAAGIDVSLHLVARLLGAAAAARTARYLEYPWTDGAGAGR